MRTIVATLAASLADRLWGEPREMVVELTPVGPAPDPADYGWPTEDKETTHETDGRDAAPERGGEAAEAAQRG